ncbi:hypothetical protein ABIE45_005586 [Methylobacterium sp. OAE515]|uniref:hypothetical protein n=1 Tax=Methylobacterium sp. OAE515 TaxID=2817895 RepID=UPI00178AD630
MAWAKIGNIKGPGSLVVLGTVAIGQTATLAIAAGIRTISVNVAGLLASENVILQPTTTPPAGYLLGLPTARAGVLDVPVYAPAMIINASYSIAARVLAVRP